MNFYRAPLSFLSAPKYQGSCDWHLSTPDQLLNGTSRFHEPIGLSLMIQAQPAI